MSVGLLVLTLGAATPATSTSEPRTPTGGPLLAFTGWVGDDRDQSVITVDTTTRELRTVARGGGVGALAWSADGERLIWIGYDDRQDGGATLYSSRPDGSDRRTLMTDHDIRAIAAAPDGSVAVVRADVPATTDCAAGPTVQPAELVLLDPDTDPAMSERTLVEVPVITSDLVFSPDGATLAWRGTPGDPCGGGADPQLALTDVASGATRQVVGGAHYSGWASFSAGGSTVITATSDGHGQDLVRTDVASATAVRQLTPELAESFPVFSPDGTKLALLRTPGVPDPGIIFRPTGEPHLVVTDVTGTVLQDLGPMPIRVEHLVWSSDGSAVALDGFTSVPACEGCDYGSADPAVWMVPLDGSGPTLLTTAGGFAGAGLAFQPTQPTPWTIERRPRTVRN